MPSIEQTAGLSVASGGSQPSTNGMISAATERGDSGGQLWRVLSRGASASLIIQISGAGLAFTVQVLLARLMPLHQYGVYVYVFTWISLLVVPALVGMDKAAIKYVASYRANSQFAFLSGFLSGSRRIVLFASIVIGLAGASLVLIFFNEELSDQQLAFLVGFLLLPVIGQIQLTEYVFRGLKQIFRAGLYTNILRPSIFLGLLGAAFLVHVPMTAAWILTLFVGTTIVVLLIARYESNKALKPMIHGVIRTPFQRVWLTGALPLLILAVMQLSLKRIDIVMLGYLEGAANAGIYSAATRIADLVVCGLIALNAMVAPLIAEMYGRGDHNGLQRLLKTAAFMNFGITLALATVLIVFGRALLGLFGEAFIAAHQSLLILLAAQLVNAAVGPVGFVMIMTHYQYQAALIFGSAALFNVGLNTLLIPRWGMVGAAYGTAAAIVWWNLAALVFVRLRMRLNPTVFQFAR